MGKDMLYLYPVVSTIMENKENISGYKIALCSGRIPIQSSVSWLCYRPDIGCFDTVPPAPIYRERNKNRGIQQSNLFPVSAGNVSRVTTMRPNPYLSAGVEMRRGKYFRGLLQLNTRPN